MRLGRSLFLSFCLLAASAVAPGACGTDGLVGGQCKTGLSLCHGRCVDLSSDEANCGRCDNRCEAGETCVDGRCGVGGEGWGGSGGDGWAGSGNHGIFAGNAGTTADSGTSGGGGEGGFNEFDVVYPLGGTGPNACTPPYTSAEQCGACHTVCEEPRPVCGLGNDGTYQCMVDCEEPLVNCFNSCVDLTRDPNNCGRCGHVCPSGLCYDSRCIGEQAGHLVSICMNLRQTTQYSQATTLLGNAVFLPTVDPVKILAYAEYADDAVQSRVRSALNWAAATRGATYRILTATEPSVVTSELEKSAFDVFLVYDQQAAPAGVLGEYGAEWRDTINIFFREGGVVVVLDGNTGEQEMSSFLNNSGILETTGHSKVSLEQIYVRDFGDVLGANIVSPFLAPRDSCVFSGASALDANTSWVVTDNPSDSADRRPVVVHRFIDVQ